MDYVKQTVEESVREYETRDPYDLARGMGIEVEEFPFRKIKGLIFRIAGRVVIVLNENLPDWLKRLIVAHEVGHRVLSPADRGYFFWAEHTFFEPRIEYEANRFAVELLTFGEEPEPGEPLEHYAARVGVPLETLLRYKRSG